MPFCLLLFNTSLRLFCDVVGVAFAPVRSQVGGVAYVLATHKRGRVVSLLVSQYVTMKEV